MSYYSFGFDNGIDPKLYTSTDLATWEECGDLPTGATRVIYGADGTLVARADHLSDPSWDSVWYSTDLGETWTHVVIANFDAIIGLDYTNEMYLAFIHDSSDANYIRMGADGITWDFKFVNVTGQTSAKFFYFNGKYCCLSSGVATCYYHEYNGSDWVSTEIIGAQFIADDETVAISDNYIVAIRNDNTAWSSPDGINWTQISIIADPYRVYNFSNKFWIVADTGMSVFYTFDFNDSTLAPGDFRTGYIEDKYQSQKLGTPVYAIGQWSSADGGGLTGDYRIYQSPIPPATVNWTTESTGIPATVVLTQLFGEYTQPILGGPMVPTFQKMNLLLAKNQPALGTKAPSALVMTDQSAVDDTFALDYVKEFQDQNLAQAIFGQPQAVGGSSYVDVKVTMPIIPTGSSTVPNVGRYLNCCGMLYALATKKHSWTPSSAVNTNWKDMSLNAYTGDKVAGDSILTKAHSAMFDAEISGEVGKPVMCTFTGKGVPDGVPAAATYLTDQLTPIATQTPAMLKNATQTINGIAFTMLKFSLKTGNDVQLIKSAADDSGNLQAMITGVQSVLTTTVYMEDQSAKNPLTGMAAGTLATTTIKFGNATDYLISLTSGTNKSEIRSAKMSVDNGLMCWDLEIRFVDNNYTLSINDAA